MPTAPNSDVIPVRKATKRSLERLKRGRTFDDVVTDLLAAAPAEPPALPERAPGESFPERDPEEQLLVARLAGRRWALWRKEGRVKDLGLRLVEYRPRERSAREVRVVESGRRGLPS